MKDIYGVMADFYDSLTGDVPYEAYADYLEEIFRKWDKKPQLVLDLACGTGSLTEIFGKRGYEMLACDASPDMLSQAQMKCCDLPIQPLFLCQPMQELNLYGTVDAVVCALDSINYLDTLDDLKKAVERVSLFLNPGGLFVFDVNTAYKLRSIAGESFVRDEESVFCVWQAAWEEETSLAEFYLDFFSTRNGKNYTRYSEDHRERAHSPEELKTILDAAGLNLLGEFGKLSFEKPSPQEERIFYIAEKRV